MLTPEKFDRYLKEEGLEAIALRRAGLTAGRQVREVFARSAKSLVLRLIKAVHMVPAPDQTKADWASLWASLTFEVGIAQ